MRRQIGPFILLVSLVFPAFGGQCDRSLWIRISKPVSNPKVAQSKAPKRSSFTSPFERGERETRQATAPMAARVERLHRLNRLMGLMGVGYLPMIALRVNGLSNFITDHGSNFVLGVSALGLAHSIGLRLPILSQYPRLLALGAASAAMYGNMHYELGLAGNLDLPDFLAGVAGIHFYQRLFEKKMNETDESLQ